MNVLEKMILKIIKSKVSNWFKMEKSLTQKQNVYLSDVLSPEKSWPNPDKIASGEEVPFSLQNIPLVGLSLKSCVAQGMKAIKSIKDNPKRLKATMSQDEFQKFEDLAEKMGIGGIGYTKLPAHFIFKERAVLFDAAIVLIMEMDKEKITKAPSIETFQMVMKTYDTLGIITNKLTDFLRQMEFQAQASHPLGGLVLYPPLAVKAGLGWFGRHGLLITPAFGARQRVAAIFVNIENLPINDNNEHTWISNFCGKCGRCIKMCPNKAILENPIEHKSGRKTTIDRDKCLPVFVKQNGCTVCIKECVFTNQKYDTIKKKIKQN